MSKVIGIDVDLYNYATTYLDYTDGKLLWKCKPTSASNNITIGKEAGGYSPSGYRNIKLQGTLYRTHRIVFLMHHKYLPKFVDHIDGNKLNNNINNLRDATKSLNGINRGTLSNNTSGYKGVSWCKRSNKWAAYTTVDGSRKHLGYYTCKHEAADAYNTYIVAIFGENVKLNEVLYGK